MHFVAVLRFKIEVTISLKKILSLLIVFNSIFRFVFNIWWNEKKLRQSTPLHVNYIIKLSFYYKHIK